MASDSEDDNKKGYGHPPRHSQFKKGESGNPLGRPKGVSSFKADLTAELQEKVALTENGKKHAVTRQQALVKNLMAAALENDVKAINVLLAWVKHFGVGEEEQTSEAADLEDLDLLEDYIMQERQKRARRTVDSARGTAPARSAPKKGE